MYDVGLPEREWISSQELMQYLGSAVSYRQLDYWCRNRVIPSGLVRGLNEGSGSRRTFHRSLIGPLRVCGWISGHLGGVNQGIRHQLVREIIDHYFEGQLELTHDICVTWPVER